MCRGRSFVWTVDVGQAPRSLNLARHLQHVDLVGITNSEGRLTSKMAFRNESTPVKQDMKVSLMEAALVPLWPQCWERDVYSSYQFMLYPKPYQKVSDLKVCTFSAVNHCRQFPF